VSAIAFLETSLNASTLPSDRVIAGAGFHWPASGVIRIEPEQETGLPAMILSVGVHGNETVPVRLIDHWLDSLTQRNLLIRRPLLILLGNPAAVIKGERFVEENMNRLFSDSAARGNLPERERVRMLMAEVRSFIERYADGMHLDLHSTIKASQQDRFALVPGLCEGRDLSLLQHWFAQLEVDAWVQNRSVASTFASFTASLGYQSATLELGQVSSLNEPIDRFLPMTQALDRLASGEESQAFHRPVHFEVIGEIIRPEGEFDVALDGFVNFRELSAGTLIAHSGERKWSVERDGDSLLFLNPDVPVGHRVALVIRPVG